MCPIVTSEDDKTLANQEDQMASLLGKIISAEKSDYSTILKLAESMQKTLILKEKYLRHKRDVSKQMDILAREDRSDITSEEVQDFKDAIIEEADFVEKARTFVNALKDLEAQSRSFLDRKSDYASSIKTVASQRRSTVKIAASLDAAKNKLQAAEKLQQMEDNLTDSTREMARKVTDRSKKLAQIRNESLEMNKLWIALKSSIDEFAW